MGQHISHNRRRIAADRDSTSMSTRTSMIHLGLVVTLCLLTASETFAFSSSSHAAAAVPFPFRPSRQQSQKARQQAHRASALHVTLGSESSEETSLPDPLIPMMDDGDDNANDGNEEEEDDAMNDSSTTVASAFYDVDYLDDDDEDTVLTDQDELLGEFPEDGFSRDKSNMLEEQEDRLYVDEFGIKRKIERCILVGVEDGSAKHRNRKRAGGVDSPNVEMSQYERTRGSRTKNDDGVYFTLEESMTEMRELIKTSGLELSGEITQRLHEVNPRTYIGSGKVVECMDLMKECGSCTVVFDAELSPGQQKALENAFNKDLLQNDFNVKGNVQEGEIKVVDRTALILDIFAQHAKTREGKLQVDLALHEYRKPRLTKMWTHLERQSGAGGVGLRGPGESQLEIDKRLLRDRINILKQKIDEVQKQRSMHRRGRERTGLPILSLCGYTNAGKSTLLNFLTRAGVMADDMLFATLDPTTRKVKLPGYKTHPEVLLTDTVGFIQKLPTHLVAAFRATLEEVKEADVLIHVIDVSNPMWEKQEASVKSVLASIGAGDTPMVRVLNKIDLLEPEEAEIMRYEAATSDNTVAVSSLQGEGMQDFVAVVEEALSDLLVAIEVEIPYTKGDELNIVHEQGNVEVVDYREMGTYVRALVPQAVSNRLEKYNVQPAVSSNTESTKEDEIDWVAIGRGRHSATSDEIELN